MTITTGRSTGKTSPPTGTSKSYPEQGAVPGEEADTFVSDAGQRTPSRCSPLPLLGWVANLGANRTILPSFSVAKYGRNARPIRIFPMPGTGSRPIAAPSSPAMIRTIPM